MFSSDELSDLILRVRKSYAYNTGKELDFYAYLMRKSMVSDNRRDKVNPSATKLLLGHQSENVTGRWYASADDEEVLNLVYSRAYKHKKTISESWPLFGRSINKKLRILAYLSYNPKFLRVELTGIEPATS